MKKVFALAFLMATIISCQKGEPENEIFEFTIEPEGESTLNIEWSDMDPDYSIHFYVSTEESFTHPESSAVVGASEESAVLNGLLPMTGYFLKIEVLNGQEVKWSDIQEFSTKYSSMAVRYETSGEEELCANVGYISGKLSTDSRVAVFMHEFMNSKSSWYKTGIVDTLIKDGYLCVAIDFKGHGCSSFASDVTRLIEEPWLLREDFDATIQMLDTINLLHSQEVVVFGALTKRNPLLPSL